MIMQFVVIKYCSNVSQKTFLLIFVCHKIKSKKSRNVEEHRKFQEWIWIVTLHWTTIYCYMLLWCILLALHLHCTLLMRNVAERCQTRDPTILLLCAFIWQHKNGCMNYLIIVWCIQNQYKVSCVTVYLYKIGYNSFKPKTPEIIFITFQNHSTKYVQKIC